MLRARDEWPLVLFTVLVPAAAGTSAVGAVAGEPASGTALRILVAGALAATLHLGRPGAARFALANLRTSWLSRELLVGGIFGAALVLHLATGHPAAEIAAAVAGVALVLAIARVYRIRTVPAWNTAATPAAFLGTTILLGAAFHGRDVAAAATAAALIVLTFAHLARLSRRGGAAAWSAAEVRDRRRAVLILRVLTAVAGAAVLLAFRTAPAAAAGCALLLASELLARVLFYASHRRVGL